MSHVFHLFSTLVPVAEKILRYGVTLHTFENVIACCFQNNKPFENWLNGSEVMTKNHNGRPICEQIDVAIWAGSCYSQCPSRNYLNSYHRCVYLLYRGVRLGQLTHCVPTFPQG